MLARGAQHSARVRVRYGHECFVDGFPRTLADAFFELRRSVTTRALEQKEMAKLVDEAALVLEKPIDGRQLRDHGQIRPSRFFRNFTYRRFDRRLAAFDMTFRQTPVVVGVLDEQKLDDIVVHSIHDTARARLETRRSW